MVLVEESITSSFASKELQDDHAPLWAYVTITGKVDDGGGNKIWTCNFCQKVVKSSYFRVKAHLLRQCNKGVALCPKVTDELKADLERICEEAANRLKPKKVPLPSETSTPKPPLLPQKRRKAGSIENAFNVEDRNILKEHIARMFYSGGLSFHLARNPYYVSSYTYAANHNISGFLPPSYNALRTSLLQQEKAHIERLLLPIKSMWPMKGVTLVSDGWTDVQRRPLINFMAINDNVTRAAKVKELLLNDLWWDKVDYILAFTDPIYEMIRVCDTDASTLHLVYEMWDSMIEKVRATIYRHEEKEANQESVFYNVVHGILNYRWGKSCTPLHCLAHSLNPRYYSEKWLKDAPNKVPPHQDDEISIGRNKCLKRYFEDIEERKKVYEEFSNFSSCGGVFAAFDSIGDRWNLDPKSWWVMYGSSTPQLQKLALKLLVQPCSSSCCERNWSTYSFVHSLKRNKMDPKRAEDLVYVHTNLRLLSRKEDGYIKGMTRMWDISGDAHDSLDGAEIELAELSLDEPELEAMLFLDDGNGGEENDTARV